MIDFRPVSFDDQALLRSYFQQNNFRTGEYSFATLYLWGHTFSPKIAEVAGRLAVQAEVKGNYTYTFPAGTAPLKPAVDALRQDAAERGVPFRLRGITPASLPELASLYPGQYTLEEERKNFDYIYDIDSLATLAGKKLHAKRNHINRFEQQNDWRFEPVSAENLAECRAMCNEWFRRSEEKSEMDYSAEVLALDKMFCRYWDLHMEGGIIRAGGRIVAFTAGEKLTEDTYLTHFEKAFAAVQGAYAIINREFARFIAAKYPEIRYVNREEDMGLENLRKAKLSYHPVFFGEKYTAVWK